MNDILLFVSFQVVIQQFQLFADKVEKKAEEYSRLEEDFDDAPEEYKGEARY